MLKRNSHRAKGHRALWLATVIEAMEQRTLLSASFANSFDYGTSGFPTDIVTADFNADGRPDIAIAAAAGTSVNVRYGNSNGTFSSSTIWPVGSLSYSPDHIAAGDVDGDGDVDLVATNIEGEYTVLKNGPGSGGFRNFTALTTVDTGVNIFETELADMNGDGKLDFVYGDVGLFIVLGNGDGTFSTTPSPVPVPGGDLSGLVIGDLDGSGLPDIVGGIAGPSSGIVRQHRVVVANNFFPSGGTNQEIDSVPVIPTALATGDFNEDGKLDFVVGGSVGGANPAQVIRYHQNDGSGGFTTGTIAFNLPVSPREVKTADIDGDGNLDVVVMTVSNSLIVVQGNGDGTFATTSTGPFATGAGANDLVVADFNADAKPDVAVANVSDDSITIHLNNSTPGLPSDTEPEPEPEPTTPALASTIDKVTLPAVFVPGDKGSATIVLANTGATAKGKVNVDLFASTDATLDGSDTALDIGTSLDAKSVNIKTDKSTKLTAKFVAPATLANGAYYLIARVTPLDITGATEASAASAATTQKVTQFGTVGERRNVKYIFTDADGTLVIYALSGAGTGTVSSDASSIRLDGTDARSRFTATTKANRAVPGSDALTSIANLGVNGAIASITGKGLTVTSSLNATGEVKTIVLDDLSNAGSDVNVVLGGSTTPVSITADRMFNAVITSGAGIASIKASDWSAAGFSEDSVTAPWIGKLTIGTDGGFAANLVLSGAGAPRGTTLGTTKIGRGVNGQLWAIEGNVGAVTVGDTVGSTWIGDITGNLKSLTVKGNFGGSLAAANIGTFSVAGDVANATVRAGWNFGADNVVDTGDDTGAVGVLTKLTIKNSLASSTIWAGVDTNGDPIDGGRIKTISPINTVAATGVEFVASLVPAKVKFDGETFLTEEDPRFTTMPL